MKEVPPIKESPVAAGEKTVDTPKKKKEQSSTSRTVKKDENTKGETAEAKKKEEPSEETNKAADDIVSAAEPPLPNVESKAAKGGEKLSKVKNWMKMKQNRFS